MQDSFLQIKSEFYLSFKPRYNHKTIGKQDHNSLLAFKKCMVGHSVTGLGEVMIQVLPVTDLRFHSRRSCVSNSCPAARTDRERGKSSQRRLERRPTTRLTSEFFGNHFLTGQGNRQQVHRLWCSGFFFVVFFARSGGLEPKHALCLKCV